MLLLVVVTFEVVCRVVELLVTTDWVVGVVVVWATPAVVVVAGAENTLAACKVSRRARNFIVRDYRWWVGALTPARMVLERVHESQRIAGRRSTVRSMLTTERIIVHSD